MNPRRILGVTVASNPPPADAVLSEHEYQLLAQLHDNIRQAHDSIGEHDERLATIEREQRLHADKIRAIERGNEEMLTAIKSLERTDQEAAETAGKAGGTAVAKRYGPLGAVIAVLAGTAHEWLPPLLEFFARGP